jgi:hypothetical protein
MTYPSSSLMRAVLIVTAVAGWAPTAALADEVPNDFPTEARADYVYGCMKANGETQDALHRCSCSVDVIATIISYDTYEKASTFISLGQMTGDNGSLFRNAKESKNVVGELKRAQAEAEMRCF